MTNTISKKHIMIELLVIMLSYTLLMWIFIPMAFITLTALYLAILLLANVFIYYYYISPFLLHKDTPASRGLGRRKTFFLRTDNLSKAWQLILTPFLFASMAIIFLAWQKNSIFFSDPDWYGLLLRFITYLPSALLQDIFFFSFILLRLKQLIVINSERYKLIVVLLVFSLIFAIFHLPNLKLMALSFTMALFLGYLFYKTPNLFVVVFIHAFLGTLIAFIYELHMKLGIFYGFEGNLIKTFILQ